MRTKIFHISVHTDIILETERCYLREFQPEDAGDMYRLNSDPLVALYTGDGPFKTLQEASDFISQYDQYKRYGMGRWAVISKQDKDFIGWCGLKYHPEKGIVEVGYRFYKKYWGQGYATESAKASLNYGFSVLKLAKIFAHSHIENSASIRVLEKLGMERLRLFDYEGVPAYLFVKRNPDIQVKEVAAIETYAVRHTVLRPGRPKETCIFEGDDLDTTFHLGAFFKEEMVGVVTMMKYDNEYQLRGMAVIEGFQKKGIGELLIKEAEARVLHKPIQQIWMNARQAAVRFYTRLGYEITGEPFEIPLIGTHYKMIKQITE